MLGATFSGHLNGRRQTAEADEVRAVAWTSCLRGVGLALRRDLELLH